MSKYSTDLLVDQDGFVLYYNKVDDGLKSVAEMCAFFKKYAQVESVYAKDLMKLSKATNPKLWKKTETELGTMKDSWNTFQVELEKIGKLHDRLANTLEDLATSMDNWGKSGTNTSKQLYKEGSKLTKETNDMMAALKTAKENYYSMHKKSDQAAAAYEAKKNDPAAKPKDNEKLQKKAAEAKDKATQADSAYKKALEKANEQQTKFYTRKMPNLLDEFQKFDENRTQFLKKIFQDFMSILNQSPPLFTETCEILNKSVAAIEEKVDVSAFIKINTGVTPPPTIEYEPYTPDPSASGSRVGGRSRVSKKSSSKIKAAPAPTTTSPTLAPGPSLGTSISPASPRPDTEKKPVRMVWGLTAEQHSLSEDERRTILESQLGEITEIIAAEEKSKLGLDKLVSFYAADPIAQKKATQEAADQQTKIDTLKNEKQKISDQLARVGSGAPGPAASADFEEGDFVEVKAKALFDYDAANDTELAFKAGDILTITEQDESGWWYAELNGKQGFIPNNYVEEIKQ